MLDLASVPWEQLSHAYGPADDVPDLLRDLESGEESRVKDATYQLYGNIWHQGTVYEATAHAVPFLLQILENAVESNRDEILTLLAFLAGGSSYHDVHQHYIVSETERNAPHLQEKIERELGWVKAAHDAVGKGLPLYLQLLEHKSPNTRMSAAFVSALFAREHAEVEARFCARLKLEDAREARALMLRELGRTTPSPPVLAELHAALEGEDELPQFCAALALVTLLREQAPSEAVEVLLGAVTERFDELESEYEGLPLLNGSLADHVESALRCLGEETTFVPQICRSLHTASGLDAVMCLLEILLETVFSKHSPKNPPLATALSAVQKQVVQSIMEAEGAWEDETHRYTTDLLQSHGLPATKLDLQTFSQSASTR